MTERFKPGSCSWGHPQTIDQERCVASVWEPGRGIRNYQCSRKRTVGEWCKQHSPEAEAARKEKANARDEKRVAAILAPSRRIKELEAQVEDLKQQVIELGGTPQ